MLSIPLVSLILWVCKIIHADKIDDTIKTKPGDWSYGTGEKRVDDWPQTCKSGRKQSPIDIFTENAIEVKHILPFVFHGYDTIPLDLEVKNKGHSLYFYKHVEGKSPSLTGGGLPENDEFEFWSGHFHWSTANDSGAEHHIDPDPEQTARDKAPLELHLVHWNKAMGKNASEAIAKNKWNSLAVLGIKFDIVKRDNLLLAPFFDSLQHVKNENDKVNLATKLPLKAFLPRGTGRFFRYNGSLTTPACQEVVIWTIFKDREHISSKQLEALRQTRRQTHRTQMNSNVRPVQPLNGRKILDIDTRDYGIRRKDKNRGHESTGSNCRLSFMLAFIIQILLYFYL